MTKYLTDTQIVEFHNELIDRYGGLRGIRDDNLLHSSLEAPKMAFGGREMYPAIFQKCAAYIYHITRNHPFNDGNKRTAFVTALAFLEVNGENASCKLSDLEDIIVEVAAGHISKDDLAIFLESGILPNGSLSKI